MNNADNIYLDYIYSQGEDVFNNNFPMILFVHSGELEIQYENKKITIGKGESVFLCSGAKIGICKKSFNTETFCGMYIGFSKIVLSELYFQHCNILYQECIEDSLVVQLPCIPCMKSLYISILTYYNWGIKPSENIIKLKQKEGILGLLLIDKRFSNILFDFW